jgi:hypothetical protein
VIRKEKLKRLILSLKNKARGQNLVEITLIMPIVLLLFAGMVEVGFAVHSYVVVSSAAREGARFGSRGVHIDPDNIANIVETSLGNAISPSFSGTEVDTKIIITEVDLEENGDYDIYYYDENGDRVEGQWTLGDLPVSSSVCEPSGGECPEGSLDIQDFITANLSFNSNDEFCVETFGCDGDFVVVEVFYFHDSVVLSGLTRDLIPDPFPIKATAVMRVLHRRAPTS